MHIGLNAHLLSSQAGYRSAGIHGYIHHLLKHLPQAAPGDWRFTAMVGAANRAQYDGITMRRSRWDNESPNKRILWEQLAQPFQLDDFDLYHALAFVAPLWLSKPCVVTVYDLSFMRYPERLSPSRRLYLRLFTGLTCRRARRVIAISHSTGDDVATLLGVPREKIDVTPLGYDAEVFKPLPLEQIAQFRAQKSLPERFWLFVGTLEPRKNLVTLLRAYAALPRAERLPLVLGGGKGWKYDDIFATVEDQQLRDEVLFPGFIPTEELPLWYNSTEVFLFPSVFEGFGLPVLEAMACGRPVITSNVSSLPEVAGDAGLCLPPHEVEAWTAALSRAYHDAQWRRAVGERGLQAAQRFTWQETARLTVESYRQAGEKK
jgi:glycosyltransferase involved in cell wall biosynthesis